MKKIIFLAILFFASAVPACTSAKKPFVNIADLQSQKTSEAQDDELRNRIERIAAASRGRVGVAAMILETGETVFINAEDRFPMQSVYKFPIAMTVLHQVDAGKVKLDELLVIEKSDFVRKGMHSPIRDKNPNGTQAKVSELLRLAVSESDGTASDVLLDLAGGARAVDGFLKAIEIQNVLVADSEKAIGRDWETQYRNWATPNGALALLRALHERRGLSERSQALLLKLMVQTATGQQRLKGLLPNTAVVAHKTGTSGTRNGVTAATNDIGIIDLPNGKHLAVVVFVSDSPADAATRERVIAEIAKALWDKWSV